MEKYGDAVGSFERALIPSPDDRILLKKLAACFKKTGSPEMRSACLLRLSKL